MAWRSSHRSRISGVIYLRPDWIKLPELDAHVDMSGVMLMSRRRLRIVNHAGSPVICPAEPLEGLQ